jgi:AcrR family transcriptional regulator
VAKGVDVGDVILKAAAKLFADRGYSGTSSREIAKLAGKTQSVVFHYFATKEAIMLALADTALNEPLERLEAICALDVDPAVKLYLAIFNQADFLCRRPVQYRAILNDAEGLRWKSAGFSNDIKKTEALVRNIMQTGHKAGLFEFDDIRLTIRSILWFVNSLLQWYDDEGEAPPRKIAMMYGRNVLKMICTDKVDLDNTEKAAEQALKEMGSG